MPGSRGAPGGITGRDAGAFAGGFAVGTGLVAGGAAVAAVETVPSSIMLPARRPAWSAISFTRMAVATAFAERGGSCTVSTCEPSSSRLPQSSRGTTTFAAGVTSCPSTVRPFTVDAETLPDALADPAATLARRSIDSIVISPSKSETASAPTVAWAVEVTLGWAAAFASADPMRTIEPSSGYE